MNQISRIDPLSGPDQLWGNVQHHAVGEALDTAWEMVLSGEQAAARLVVAKMVAVHQHRLNGDAGLLARTVAVLAAAHGFGAIERLLRATGHGSVKVRLAGGDGRGADLADGVRGAGDPRVVDDACIADRSSALSWSGRLLQHCPQL